MFAFATRETVFLTCVKDAILKTPYQEFCQRHSLHPMHDLPILLFQNFKSKNSFDMWVSENAFISPPMKTYMLDLFVHATRRINALRRCIARFARSKRPSQTTTDLSMEPFGAPSTRIDVFDCGKKYTFKISDLLNLIHSSLTHANEFICSPVAIKNPYTGLPFSKPTLYSIHMLLCESRYAVPPLFSLFVASDFSLRRFEVQHEPLLRDHVIKAHIVNMTAEKRREEIREMFNAVRVYHPIRNKCDPIFRIKSLKPEELDPFSKWLHLYFVHLYSLNTHYSFVAHRSLVNEMIAYRKAYPMFGALKGRRVV